MEQQSTGAKYLQVSQTQEYINPQLSVPSFYAISSYYMMFFLQLNRRIQDKGQSTLHNKVTRVKVFVPKNQYRIVWQEKYRQRSYVSSKNVTLYTPAILLKV
jgi:hypothetical protein